jgi:hypothetical protein
LTQEKVPQLGALDSKVQQTTRTSPTTGLTQLRARKPIVMIKVPVIITFRGPSLSITVPPMVAPAKVMHDETDPIHAVTEL